MNKYFAIISSAFIAGSVHAASDAEIYHGWAAGNPDLATEVVTVTRTSDVSPGSYDRIVYNGFEKGNSELSFGSESGAAQLASQPEIGDSFGTRSARMSDHTSIYNGFEIGNPDL